MKDGGLFSYDSLVQALAGATGSVSAQLITMPLTTSFTRAQLEKGVKTEGPIDTVIRILNNEGIDGLFRGCLSTCESVAVSNFVYFYTFHGLKNSIGLANQTPLKDLLFACVAGCCNVLLTNPLWVVNFRLRMVGVNKDAPRYKGILDGLMKISLNEGFGALWNGTKASLLLVSNPAIKFTVYEFLKRRFKAPGLPLSANQSFLLGAASTAVATILTYPLQMVQAKARNSPDRQTMKEIFLYIVRKEGGKGLYKGLDSKLLQSMLAAGFMFLTYEKIAVFVFKILGGRRKINR